jgi:hypothetical protein
MKVTLKCKEEVRTEGTFNRWHPCSNSAKKDGYCLIHHPDKISERHKRNEIKRNAAWDRRPSNLMAKEIKRLNEQNAKLLAALKQTIKFLDGHISRNILFDINKLIAEAEENI